MTGFDVFLMFGLLFGAATFLGGIAAIFQGGFGPGLVMILIGGGICYSIYVGTT